MGQSWGLVRTTGGDQMVPLLLTEINYASIEIRAWISDLILMKD